MKLKLFNKHTVSTEWTAERVFKYCENQNLEVIKTGGNHIFIEDKKIESYYYVFEFKNRELDEKIVLIQKVKRGNDWYKTNDGSPKDLYRDRTVMRLIH